jgi:hypothetical protein
MKIILRLFYFYIIDNSLCFCFIHNSAANITKQDVVTNGSTPLERPGIPWKGLRHRAYRGPTAYKYSVPAHCRFCSREYS